MNEKKLERSVALCMVLTAAVAVVCAVMAVAATFWGWTP